MAQTLLCVLDPNKQTAASNHESGLLPVRFRLRGSQLGPNRLVRNRTVSGPLTTSPEAVQVDVDAVSLLSGVLRQRVMHADQCGGRLEACGMIVFTCVLQLPHFRRNAILAAHPHIQPGSGRVAPASESRSRPGPPCVGLSFLL